MKKKVYTAHKIFTGHDWLPDHAIVVIDNVIVDLLPVVSLPAGTPIQQHSHIIVPAFIDLQIYGGYGKLFAAFPDSETLHLMHSYCLNGGAGHFLPTVATNSVGVVKNCIHAVSHYWKEGGKGVLGLHLEGPWINPIKRGAHLEEYCHKPSLEEVTDLIEFGDGIIRMITLAPEICSKEIITFLREKDIILSAGHSNATFQEAMESFNNGIYNVTHLFNAMSPFHHREPGLPAAVIQHHQVMCSIVPDGYHVDYEVINIAKKLIGERLFVITDAVTNNSKGPYQHQFEGDRYTCNGILSGSALTMIKAVSNCIHNAQIPEGEALRMGSLYPAKVLGLDHRLGLIKKGYNAELTFLDNDWNVLPNPLLDR